MISIYLISSALAVMADSMRRYTTVGETDPFSSEFGLDPIRDYVPFFEGLHIYKMSGNVNIYMLQNNINVF